MYILNYDEILKTAEIPSYIKDLVRQVQTSGGTTIGTWVYRASSTDLYSVYNSMMLIKSQQFSDPKKVGELPFSIASSSLTLLDVLSSAEGLDLSETRESTKTRFNILQTIVSLEMFKRRGLDLSLKYDIFSLSEDMSEALTNHFLESMVATETELLKLGIDLPVKFEDLILGNKAEVPSLPKQGFFSGIAEFIRSYKRDKPSGPVES